MLKPHLLTQSFLQKACARALQDEGILTICTDSRQYGEWLLETCSSEPLNAIFHDALKGAKEDKVGRVARKKGICLCSGSTPRSLRSCLPRSTRCFVLSAIESEREGLSRAR
ncbi:unnamed protein product [Effrenium voratum]|nr:unnamed protein product [Effrenium voratum]